MASKNISLDELKRIRPLKKGALNKERKATQKYINEFKLSEIRKNLEFTQIEVAEIIGIDQSNVSRIEKGILETVKIETLQAYIEALGGELEIVAKVGRTRIKLNI